MDPNSDWTASALFSPSKARVQQAQAKDWAFVDAWLAKKYGRRLTTFERNEETLQALLNLATLNDGADEQRALVERVEKTALQTSSKRVANEDGTFTSVLKHLSSEGRESLDALAQAAVLLQSPNSANMADRLCDLSISHFDAYEQFRSTEALQEALKREQARLTALLDSLKNDDLQAPEDIGEQTSEWTRNTKHLRAKVAEYDERLSALRADSTSAPRMERLAQSIRDTETLRDRLANINAKLSAFQSLPSEPKAARAKVESARNELRELTTKRDRLFEGLVDD